MKPHEIKRLDEFPYVLVRVDCRFCSFKRRFRLARLAARCGPDILLEELLDLLACGFGRPKKLRKYHPFCGVQFQDLNTFPVPPPDIPAAAARPHLTVVGENEPAAATDLSQIKRCAGRVK